MSASSRVVPGGIAGAVLFWALTAQAQPGGNTSIASPVIQHVTGGVNIRYGDIVLQNGQPVTLSVSANFPDDKLERLAMNTANRLLPEMQRENQAHAQVVLAGVNRSTRWVITSTERLSVELKKLTEVVNEIWAVVIRLETKIDALKPKVDGQSGKLQEIGEQQLEQRRELQSVARLLERLIKEEQYEAAKQEAEAQRFLLESWSSLAGLGLFGVLPSSGAILGGIEGQYRRSIVTLDSPLLGILSTTWIVASVSALYAVRLREHLQIGKPGDQVVGEARDEIIGLAPSIGVVSADTDVLFGGELGWRAWLLEIPQGRVEASVFSGLRLGRTSAWIQPQLRLVLFDTGIDEENERYNPFGPPVPLLQRQSVSLLEFDLGVSFNF